MNTGVQGKQVALASANPPFWGEQTAVPLSVDLSGGLRLGGGGVGALYDARMTLGTANAGINDGDTINQPVGGYVRSNTGDTSGGVINRMFQLPAGAATAAQLQVRNGRRCLNPLSTALVDGLWLWRPWANAQNPLTFSDAWLSGGALGGAIAPAVSIEAAVRKLNAGDGSDCHFFFGFTYVRILNPSRQIVRLGLLGDGLGGYQFGSVNAPDGGAAGTNAATDVDANAVQPAGLTNANLGTNWFVAKIRLVPPTPTQTGRWEAYLNGVLVATFATTANFPRGYNPGAGPLDDGYRAIECGFGCYANTAAPVASPLIADQARVVVEG